MRNSKGEKKKKKRKRLSLPAVRGGRICKVIVAPLPDRKNAFLISSWSVAQFAPAIRLMMRGGHWVVFLCIRMQALDQRRRHHF